MRVGDRDLPSQGAAREAGVSTSTCGSAASAAGNVLFGKGHRPLLGPVELMKDLVDPGFLRGVLRIEDLGGMVRYTAVHAGLKEILWVRAPGAYCVTTRGPAPVPVFHGRIMSLDRARPR
jgi:hypothetical protein